MSTSTSTTRTETRNRYRTAFYAGTCRVCGQRFPEGAEIVFSSEHPRGSKCAHVACYEGQPAPSAPPAPEPKPAPEPGEAFALAAVLIVEALLLLARWGAERAVAAAPAETRHKCYDRLRRWVKAGVNRIWITGPAGTGKTHAAEQIARELGIPFYVVTPIESRYDGLGYCDAQGRYVETPIYRWAVDPDPRAILLLDEVDGFQPGALIALNAVLANGIGVFPHQQVAIASTKIVIGTANTLGDGPDVKYSGRLAQDASVVDRFSAWLEWGVDEEVEAAIAQAKVPGPGTRRAVAASQAVRRALAERKVDLDWGPRRTYAAAALVAAGEPVRDALLAAGLMRLPDREALLRDARL